MVDLLRGESGIPDSAHEAVKKLLPYASRYFEVDGCRMHYLDEGQGPVVLLLHGNPTWCFYYRRLIELLKGNFRVIAPDHIGCGLSERPIGRHFRAVDRLEHLDALLSHLGVSRFSLVMHDWGGPIGTALALRRVEQVERLVYLNTTLTETESLPFIIKRATFPLIGRFLTRTTRHFVKLVTGWGVCHSMPSEVKAGYLYPYMSRSRREAIWDFVADIPFNNDHPSYSSMFDLAKQLPALAEKEVLVLWGMQDRCFHREMLNQVTRHFPRAEVVEIGEASHLVIEDSPQITLPVISEFLQHGAIPSERPAVAEADLDQINPLLRGVYQAAQERPHALAAVEPNFMLGEPSYRYHRYRDFVDRIERYQRGLAELGLSRDDKVLMLVTPGVDFLALSYAVMGRGATPIFLDPGMGTQRLLDCIAEMKPNVFIGSPRAQLLRLLKRKLFTQIKFHITASEWLITGKRGRTLAYLQRFSSKPLQRERSAPRAMIAYTSGATGRPKGVVFSPENLKAQLRIFREEFGFEAGRLDLPLLPIFSLFGVACGVGAVFPPLDPSRPIDLDPPKVLRIIRELEISYSFGSPTLWNKIAEYCVRTREELVTMSKIMIAGAPVRDEVLAAVKQIAPQCSVFTPYGATEALPVTLIDSQTISSHKRVPAQGGEYGTLVGQPLPGLELAVIVPRDGRIEGIEQARYAEPCEIGEVIVRGENVSQEYFENAEATAAAKIRDPRGMPWHRMGDLGYLDRSGMLYFCGRKPHAVHYRGRNYYSIPVERIFNAHSKVRRSALVRLAPSGEPAIVVEPLPEHFPETQDAKQIFAAELRVLALSDVVTEPLEHFFFHHAFPVDGRHNAKIFRDRLGEWASTELTAQKGGR